ncbi:MAG: iron chelate uptake ABC transporter family permease subunit, partial [Chloroflexota bacterium]
IPLSHSVRILLTRLPFFDFSPGWRTAEETIILQLRLPRVVGAALVGAALATSGVLFQGLLRNPMADPYIIGTSAGAALGATLAMLLPISLSFLGFGIVSLTAFATALITVSLVYNLSRVGSKTPVINLLLAGFVVSALLAAVMTFIIAMGDRFGLNLRSVHSFLMGNLAVTSWQQIAVVAPLVAIGTMGAWLFTANLNAFSLGEEGASYLGVSVERQKLLILVTASLLTASAVAISGLVGFVGLIVPHALRLTLGPDHRLLLPASALAGAVFLVLSDLLARSLLAPIEIPVGVITAILGAPLFIYLLRNTQRRYHF